MKRYFKRYILTVLFLLYSTVLLSETVAVPPSNYGTARAGSVVNPFLISNLANLRWFSENDQYWGNHWVRHHYLQTADIDAYETRHWNDGRGFNPIGHSRKVFNIMGFVPEFLGQYDGNNFTIRNLYINSPVISPLDPEYELKQPQIGLFGDTLEAVIKNVRLVDLEFHSIDDEVEFVGSLIGHSHTSTILNSSASGSITVQRQSEERRNGYIGGLVGMGNVAFIENCFSIVHLIDNLTVGYIGGLAGRTSYTPIINSFFNGLVESEIGLMSEDIKVGGLVGFVRFSAIQNCYVASNSEFRNVNALFGTVENVSVRNSFWDIETTGIKYIHNEVLPESETILIDNFGLPTHWMKDANTFIEKGWDFENIWDINIEINEGYPYLRDEHIKPRETGSIRGRVSTVNGVILNSLLIYLEGTYYRVFTNMGGHYNFTFAPVGSSHIIVYKNGEAIYRSVELEIVSGQTLTHNIVLELANEDDVINIRFHSFLSQNFPNPFNPSTTIKFTNGRAGNVRLNVYNVRGQLLKTLLDEVKDIGNHSVIWDGIDQQGKCVSSGIYFYRLETSAGSEVRRMVLMK